MSKNNLTIPNGWQSQKLGFFGTCIRGVSYSPENLRAQKDDSSIILLRSNNIKDGQLNLKDIQVVSNEKVKKDQIIKKEDVFICMSNGSKNLVGKNVMLKTDLQDYTVGAFCALYRILRKNSVNANFVEQLFQSNQYISQIQEALQGSSINNLKNSQIEDLSFLFPSIDEQEKISEILLSVDDEIKKMDAIISETGKLKTGLMNNLFTKGVGHGKFKGTKTGIVPEEWTTRPMEDLVEIRSGDSPSSFKFVNEGYPFFKVDDMNYSDKFMIDSDLFFSGYKKDLMPKGMIVFPKRGASIFLNKVRILGCDSYFDTNVMGLIAKKEVDNIFLYYFINFIGLSKFADTTSIPQINNKHIFAIEINLPSFDEQKKIAAILSITDEKIAISKKLKAKLLELKKGLMTDLLTGKNRV